MRKGSIPPNPATIQEETTKAIVYGRHGSPDVLELTDISQPVVRDDQVLVRVRAASLNPADWHFMRGLPYLVRVINGMRKPRKVTVLASDLAGQVDAVGRNVTRFRRGKRSGGRGRPTGQTAAPRSLPTAVPSTHVSQMTCWNSNRPA